MNYSEVQLPSNRKFGFFFAAVFAVVAVYLLVSGEIILCYIIIVVSATFFSLALFKDEALLPLNKLWMRIGILLGKIVSPIVLGIIFFGLFTPISLLTRKFGRDELRLKLEPRQSHWKLKDTSVSPSEAFKNQF